MFIVLSPVSNEVPEHPCVSPVSNQVFERRLIEKYIAENGVDPINGQPLSEEQLIDIKGTAAQITLFLSEVQMLYGRGGKSTKIFYSSKSTITLLKFYLSTSKSTSLKIYSSKSKK